MSRGVKIAATRNEEKCVCFPGDYLGTFLVLLKLVAIINRRVLQANTTTVETLQEYKVELFPQLYNQDQNLNEYGKSIV